MDYMHIIMTFNYDFLDENIFVNQLKEYVINIALVCYH